MEAIKNWLNGPKNYNDGVQLYLQFGKDERLKRLFTSEDKTDFKVKKLFELLKQLYLQPAISRTEQQLASLEVQNKPQQYKHWPPIPIQDSVLVALHDQWKPLYSEMMSLQQRIYDIALQGDNNPNKQIEAYNMARKILSLDDQVDAIYARRNFYYEHGRLPDDHLPNDKEETIVDAAKAAMQLENINRYIRRYEGKLKKSPADPSSDKWASLLKQYKEKRDQIKTLINNEN